MLKLFTTLGKAIGSIFNIGKGKTADGSGLSKLGNMVTSLFGVGSSIGQARREMQNQKELMKYQNELQQQNYQKELADKKALIADDRRYNSIGAQMRRAKSAGISPLAALGVSSNSSISAQSPSTGGVSVPTAPTDSLGAMASNLFSSIRATQDARKIELQERQQRIDRERSEAQNALDDARTERERKESLKLDIELANLDDRLKQELQNLIAQGKVDEAQARLQNSLADTEDVTREGKVLKQNAEIKRIIAEYTTEDVMRSINAELARSNIRLNAQRVSESISVESVNWQRVNNLFEEEKLTIAERNKCEDELKTFAKQRERMQAEIENIKSDTSLNDTRKKELISRIVANYTHSVTDVTDKLTRIFQNSGKSKNESNGIAESLVSDVLLGATGAIFD